jgi:hypothetical protein
MAEDNDSIESMERQDTKTKLPGGWLLLLAGLVIWGVFYMLTYTPQISGWTQESAYLESLKK